MFVRNGQALGSVLHSAAPGAKRPPKPKKAQPEPAPEPEPAPAPEPEPVQESGPPDTHALKQEWIDYAVDSGADPEEAEALTKAELIELYGGDD